jgi:hypothetical protein
VFLVAFGPPILVLGEAFFGWLFLREYGVTIPRNRRSIKRIAVAVPVVLAVYHRATIGRRVEGRHMFIATP